MSNVIKHLSIQKKLELSSLQHESNDRMLPIKNRITEAEEEILRNEQILEGLLDKVNLILNQPVHNIISHEGSSKIPSINEISIEIDNEDTEAALNNEETNLQNSSLIDETEVFNSEMVLENEIVDASDHNDFWGNLDDFSHIDNEFKVKSIFDDVNLNFDVSDKPGQINKQVEELQSDVVNKSFNQEEDNNEIDNVLVEQIDTIKSMYIVGKLAGEDLSDNNGNLIISKSSLITKEVVDRANRAGKLADLIINMQLSGPGVG
jgi:hypothetical protein